MNEQKRAILEAVAAAEQTQRPFDRAIAGVSYEDIKDEFSAADFGVHPAMYIPPRLAELSEATPPKLEQIKPPGSEASANYRVTEHGWNRID